MSVSPRKRLSGEERRAAILDSALAVFAERGYHASSIDDIAREGGISKALIYEHFSSKEQLYGELIQHHADELVERIATAIDQTGGVGAARLGIGVDAFYGFVEEHRVAWRMLFREVTDAEVAAVLDRILTQVTALVAMLIAEDPGAGTAEEDEVAHDRAIGMLAQMLVGSVQALANWWGDHQEIPREKVVEITMDYAWVGLERLGRGERWRPGGGHRPPPAQ